MVASCERGSAGKTGLPCSSYLVRHWRWTDGSERLAVEHVQSGSRTVVASPSDAIAWIGDQEPATLRQDLANGCAAEGCNCAWWPGGWK